MFSPKNNRMEVLSPEHSMNTKIPTRRKEHFLRMLAVLFRKLLLPGAALLSMIQVCVIRLLFPLRKYDLKGPIKNILIIKLDELGDLVMITPFLRALTSHLPEANVTLMVNRNNANLLKAWSGGEVIALNLQCTKILRWWILPWRHFRTVQSALSKKDYDLCIVPRRDADLNYATFIAYLSKAKRRISYSEKCDELKTWINRGFDLLLTDAIESKEIRHEVEYALQLLELINIRIVDTANYLEISEEELHRASELLPLSKENYVVICPTSGHSALKQWGIDRFSAVVSALASRGVIPVLVGAPNDIVLGRILEKSAPGKCVNLIGDSSLGELAALNSRCRVFLGTDAGPMHIATAVGTKTVGIFGASCPHRFAPWGEASTFIVDEIECSPCHDHKIHRCHTCVHSENICMKNITPERVLLHIIDSN